MKECLVSIANMFEQIYFNAVFLLASYSQIRSAISFSKRMPSLISLFACLHIHTIGGKEFI